MRLKALIRDIPELRLESPPDLEITGVEEDSRRVVPGNLFVARSGNLTDGSLFIRDAERRGAVAILAAREEPVCSLPQLICSHPSGTGARLVQAFHGNPSHHLKTIGITGTNGKTTSAYLLRHVLGLAGMPCGLIGTVENDDGRTAVQAKMTTPSPAELAKLLNRMVSNGCEACAMETSSHALHQSRVAGIRFAAGIFTNLTRDHIDYHKTMEAYADAKAILFRSLEPTAVASVNGDDPWLPRIIDGCRARVIRWGFTSACDYRAENLSISPQGTTFTLLAPSGTFKGNLKLIGRHNVANVLGVLVVLHETVGMPIADVLAALSQTNGAPGRLQSVDLGQNFAVLVDYAHTGDALENVLSAVRPCTRGKLRILFGCGGDRDSGKRAPMATVCERLADAVVLTSDNPRSEDPAKIIADAAQGFTHPEKVIIEPDRRTAIGRIIADAREGDVVILAGKGHENYQIIGTTTHHFDDVEEATTAIRKRLAL